MASKIVKDIIHIKRKNLIHIKFETYRKILHGDESYDQSYNGSTRWDTQSGLLYISSEEKYRKMGYHTFKIIDKHKFFLAKIKHGF